MAAIRQTAVAECGIRFEWAGAQEARGENPRGKTRAAGGIFRATLGNALGSFRQALVVDPQRRDAIMGRLADAQPGIELGGGK
jgi:hypothetical protein